MYKTVPLVLILFLITGGRAQERADVIDSITPSSAIFFLKTSRINTLVSAVSFVADNLLSRERADAFTRKRNVIRDRTGVDPLNIESLAQAGIDVERAAAIAIFPSGARNEERIALFIPVLDEKTFPLAFVEMLRRGVKAKDADFFPAITEYRGHSTHQIRRDIYTVAFEGVFIVASTGELLRKIIDVRADNEGYLALDPLYRESLGRGDARYDIRIFAARDFLKEALREMKNEEPEKNEGAKKDGGPSALMRERAFEAGALIMTGSDRDDFNAGASHLNAVEYAFLGVSARPGVLDIDMGIKFNETSARVNTFIDLVKTGMTGRSLRVNDAAAYSFLSLDFDRIEELCSKGGPGCRYYARIKEGIREDLGIDFQSDLLPHQVGVLNIVAGQPKGVGGGYLFYVPMKNPQSARTIWEKSRAYLKKKHEAASRYGEAKIGNRESHWHIDSKNRRNYMVYDERGVYLGNDTDLIATALGSPETAAPGGDRESIVKQGEGVFFLARLKKESFFGALLTLYSYRIEDIRLLVEKMTECVVTGEKRERYLSLDITIKLSRQR